MQRQQVKIQSWNQRMGKQKSEDSSLSDTSLGMHSSDSHLNPIMLEHEEVLAFSEMKL